jgi:dolichol kinase/phosphoserine phosphatase
VQAPNSKKPRLIVFDVEGVLIPKNRFFFEVGKTIGFTRLIRILFMGFLYQIGVIPLKSALKHIFKGLRGVKNDLLVQVAEKMPIMPSAKGVFGQLRAEGCKTVLISSGLPDAIVKKLATVVGADYGFGFEVGLKGETLTGEIWGDVIEANGKYLVLSQLLVAEGLSLSDCVVVADDRNNSSIFLPKTQKIGFNPDFVLRIKADEVVTGKLSKILPVINGKQKHASLPSENDFVREAIHASGFFVPIVASLISKPVAAFLICVVITLYVISELLRLDGKYLPVISAITRRAASQTEMYDFAAAPLYFAIGILATLLLFPAPASSAAIAIFALGDSTASIFGGLISKTPLPLNKSKTLEGSLTGFFFAFLAGSFFISPTMALIGAAVAMVIEFLPLPVNDNVLIPLVTGLTLWLII